MNHIIYRRYIINDGIAHSKIVSRLKHSIAGQITKGATRLIKKNPKYSALIVIPGSPVTIPIAASADLLKFSRTSKGQNALKRMAKYISSPSQAKQMLRVAMVKSQASREVGMDLDRGKRLQHNVQKSIKKLDRNKK